MFQRMQMENRQSSESYLTVWLAANTLKVRIHREKHDTNRVTDSTQPAR